MMPTLSLPVTPQVVIISTCGAMSHNKVGIITCVFKCLMLSDYPIMILCCHDTEKLSSLILAFCEENPPVTGGFPSQRANNADPDSKVPGAHLGPVSPCWPHEPCYQGRFGVFFNVSLNKLFSKQQSWWGFEMLWHSSNVSVLIYLSSSAAQAEPLASPQHSVVSIDQIYLWSYFTPI